MIRNAVALDRAVALRLNDIEDDIRKFAATNGFSLPDDIPEVATRLMRLGIEAWRARNEKPK